MFRLIGARSSLLFRSKLPSSAKVRWMSSDMGLFDKITFIGTGKMAQAMIDPLITNGFQPAEKVSVYDVSTKSMQRMKEKFPDIQTSGTIGEAVHDAECIVLAVKPQNVNESFWAEFPSSDNDGSGFRLRDDATLLSILAGTPVKDFAPSGISKVVRRYELFASQSGVHSTVDAVVLFHCLLLVHDVFFRCLLYQKYAQHTIDDWTGYDGVVLHPKSDNLRSKCRFETAQYIREGYLCG